MSIENENNITLVEKYFDHELSEAELNQLFERLETDDDFKAMFDQEKGLIKGIRYEGLRRDLEMLKQVESNLHGAHGQQSEKTVRFSSWYYKVAAAIIVLAVIASLLLPVRDDSEKLFQSHFKPYPNVFEPTLRGTDEVTQRAEAFLAYEQGDYQRALEGFKEILKTGNEPGVLLLTGNANLILGNVDEAKNNFLTLIKNYDELDTQAKWFLSLCYLKEGDSDKARMMLEELEGTEISYANKAKELLRRVE